MKYYFDDCHQCHRMLKRREILLFGDDKKSFPILSLKGCHEDAEQDDVKKREPILIALWITRLITFFAPCLHI